VPLEEEEGEECVTRRRLAPMAVVVALGWLPSTLWLTGCGGNSQFGATINPQVALYTVAPSFSGSVVVQFGLTTNYGLTTSSQPVPGNNVPVNIYVAGMLPKSVYHMRAVFTLADGSQIDDVDHTFATGAVPFSVPTISVSNPSGLPPQSGIEMIDFLYDAVAIDLSGNVIWNYKSPNGTGSDAIQPIKLLPNGHLLLVIGPSSSYPVTTSPDPGTINVIREIDLAGDTIRELSLSTLNSRLAAAGFNLTALAMHHDVEPLPNGHLLIIVNSTQQFTDLTGYPGTTTVLGDQIVDLDPNWNPVWVWNSFDHLDVNRHPMNFPDWTHTNAVLYSPDDGNIIISMRHQNWILKINYEDGNGDGSVLWHLGEGGDFTLQGGTDPTDWFWAQHKPNFVGTSTAGVFSLAVFDDGNDREFPQGPPASCETTFSSTCYSTGEVFQLDEATKTATLISRDVPNLFSFFGGNAEVLANGDLEYDACAASPGATVLEVMQPESSRQVIWQMVAQGAYAYRAFRLPSLYPGVQW
jgi:arylsulfate sulfotransferase